MTSFPIDPLPNILRQRRRRRLQREEARAGRRRAAALTALGLISLLLAASLLTLGLVGRELTRRLPPVDEIARLLNPPDGLLLQPTRLYDRSGQHLLDTLAPDPGPRPYLPLIAVDAPHLSDNLVQATLATADPDFWQQRGYTLRGLTDPAFHPTLAQKLVSDLLLWQEPPDWRRAVRERLLAARLTAYYGNEQILEWYLNSADYGYNAFGAESAAQFYFGKSAADLTLSEAAVLAAVSQMPALNPLDAPEAAWQRGQEVLTLMRLQQRIDEAAYQAALKAPPVPVAAAAPENPLTALVLAQAADKIPRERLLRGGLTITTSLDADLQNKITCLLEAVRSGGDDCPGAAALPFKAAYDVHLQALVLDPQNGEVLALTAAPADRWENWLPAGDALYPFIYLTAFTRGFSPASLVWDVPDPSVEDRDGVYHGPLRLRVALVNGDETPAAHMQAQIGAENIRRFAGLHGLSLPGADLTNGETLVSPLTLAQAYGVWADGGILAGQNYADRIQTSLLRGVRDVNGGIWLDASQPQVQAVLAPQIAWLLNDILRDPTVRRSSAASLLEIGDAAAVKIAHAPNARGIWVIGYTPACVILLWMDSPAAPNESLAVGIWQTLMRTAQQDAPPIAWTEPPGISHVTVCDPSGMLPTEYCPQTVREVFLAGNEPTQADTLYQPYLINRETGLLATVFTPPELVEARVYINVPPGARDWAQANGWTPPPNTYDTVVPPRRDPDAAITSPDLFACVSGEVAVMGSAGGDHFAWYRLQTGFGLNPARWTQIGARQERPVSNGRLALWDTRTLADGLYALQLMVVQDDGSLKSAVTQVTVDNTPPRITQIYPADGDVLDGQQAAALLLQAGIEDNLDLQQVVFYLDGRRLATLTSPPWHALADDLSAGAHTLRVTAIDCAGNSAEETVRFQVFP